MTRMLLSVYRRTSQIEVVPDCQTDWILMGKFCTGGTSPPSA